MIDTLYTCFKHWSNNGSVYIISDLHLNDKDCKLMDKNWITVEKQLEILKKTVHKNDTLIILGDVGDKELLKQAWKPNKKPHIVLLLGNHDAPGQFHSDTFFNEVYDGPLFIAERLLLSHEPIDYPYALNIHGHDHSGNKIKNHVNLACNVCEYTPKSLDKIIKSGIMKYIPTIHRVTIDKATQRKRSR